MMIDALIYGHLIRCDEDEGGNVEGRIVIGRDKPVQFTARRGTVKRQLLSMAQGTPLAVAGSLTTRVCFDKSGKPYVRYDLEVSAILTAEPSPLRRLARTLTGD